jgi:alkaline phosphatase D
LPFDVRADGQETPLKSMDNWNGYTDARRRMAALIAERQLRNVVIGSGDMHQHLVGYLPSDLDDPLSPPLASEFLATSVTSGGSGSPRQAHQLHTLDHNPHVALLNNQRGYQLYRVDAGRWATDIKVLDQVDRPEGQLSKLATYVVEQGKPGPILL